MEARTVSAAGHVGLVSSCRQGDVTARKFAGDVCVPFSDDIRSALTALLDMRWVDVQSELSEGDWVEFQRLCLPESPDFIMDLLDYYAFFTYSMFRGQVRG